MSKWIRFIPKTKEHGVSKHPLYGTWNSMIHRCYNSESTNFPYYGAKGVTVCERWIQSFWAFVEDVGERPMNHELSRNEDQGNYEPVNCQWLPAQENRNPVLFTHKM